jgi:hypothetical protein
VAFAALGLLLAAVGIYGMTRMVAQRTDGIGLRMALGAQARGVLGSCFGRRVIAAGLGIGLVDVRVVAPAGRHAERGPGCRLVGAIAGAV